MKIYSILTVLILIFYASSNLADISTPAGSTHVVFALLSIFPLFGCMSLAFELEWRSSEETQEES